LVFKRILLTTRVAAMGGSSQKHVKLGGSF